MEILQALIVDREEPEDTKRYALLAIGSIMSNGTYFRLYELIADAEDLFSFVEKKDLMRWLLSTLIVSSPHVQSSVLLAMAVACTSCMWCSFLGTTTFRSLIYSTDKTAVELVAVDIDKVILRLASRKFATDVELIKRLKEEAEDAKQQGRQPTHELLPNAEVASSALALLERIDLVLRTNSGVGMEESVPPPDPTSST